MRRALAWLCLLAGCRFDASAGSRASVSCSNDTECPKPLRCQTTVGLCVDELDETPPSLVQSDVSIVALPGNPIERPTALGPVSQARVSFVVSEPLAETPVIAALDDAGQVVTSIDCSLAQSSALRFEFWCVPMSGVSDALLQWRVSLVDERRLTATETLQQRTVLDLLPPEPPSTADAGVFMTNAPWGDSTRPRPWSTVTVSAGALHGATRFVVRGAGVVLGSASVADGGQVLDVQRLEANEGPEIRGLDEAGNASAWARITHGRWRATYVGKVAEQLFPNPHRFQVVRALALGVEGFPATERGAADGIDAPGGAVATIEGAGRWISFDPRTGPSFSYVASAYDPLRSRVVRFGGVSPSLELGSSVYEWSGLQWERRVPIDPEGDGNPTGRYAAHFTWDPRLRGVVLYGGLTDEQLKDTWLWNGVSWRRLPDAPVAVIAATYFYDPVVGALVLSGGLDSNTISMASFRLDTTGWTSIATPPFGIRIGASVCTVPLVDAAFVLGGHPTDLGVWSATNNEAWARFEAPAELARTNASCAYDQARERLVLQGGSSFDGGLLGDTWEIAGTVATKQSSDAGPPAGYAGRLAYDPARNQMLLVGEGSSDSTWALTAQGWTQAFHRSEPSTIALTANLAWFEQLNSLIAFGASFNPLRFEVNALSTTGWTRFTVPLLPSSGGARFVGGAPDPTSYVGGSTGEPAQVFRYDPTSMSWPVVMADAGFLAEQLSAAAWANGEYQLFAREDGGYRRHIYSSSGQPVSNDWWPVEWVYAATSPDGGSAVLSTTSGLSQLRVNDQPADVLPDRMIPRGLIQDVGRGSLLVPGGLGAVGSKDDVWEWRPGGWSRLPVATIDDLPVQLGPFPLLGVSRSSNGAGLVAVERDERGFPGRAWLLAVATERPMAMARFSTTTLPSVATIDGVAVIGVVGATANGTNGVDLLQRWAGFWSPSEALNDAPQSTPANARYELDDTDLFFARRQISSLRELTFGLVPRAPNGRDFGKLSVDSLELEVRYRWPQ